MSWLYIPEKQYQVRTLLRERKSSDLAYVMTL